jgi:hypothetical protein
MHNILQPLFIVLLFIVVRAGDIAIGAAYAKDTLRALLYGITALLALIAMIFMIFV